jgi:sugar/nucleoside kinase (ribokinase family)
VAIADELAGQPARWRARARPEQLSYDVVATESPLLGARVHAEVSIRPGGSAVNAALGALAAGASATVVGRIGADPSGELVAGALAGYGIETHLARDAELPTGVTVALGGGSSSPGVVASRGANTGLSPEDVPDPIDADALLVSGFALLQRGSSRAARSALDRFAGAWAAVDLASPRLVADVAGAGFDELSAGANVILATAEEARALTGAGPEAAARMLASRFSVVCVKLGVEGALAAEADRIERAAAERVDRRSPFGAGDAFGATLLVALARGDPLGRALELACETGARAVSSASKPEV